jgi:hypothetical protein
VDKREYLRVVQVGTVRELLKAISYVTDYHLTLKKLDAKVDAMRAHKPIIRLNKKPKFRFGPRFFTKLNRMPAVSIEVKESRSYIRKTCYGFRDKVTQERIYLRIDPGSIVEFRDSPCGYLIGTRYLVPNLDRMKSKRWDKVNRLLNRLLQREGIIVTASQVAKYRRSSKSRCKLAKRIVTLRNEYIPMRNVKRKYHYEKARK